MCVSEWFFSQFPILKRYLCEYEQVTNSIEYNKKKKSARNKVICFFSSKSFQLIAIYTHTNTSNWFSSSVLISSLVDCYFCHFVLQIWWQKKRIEFNVLLFAVCVCAIYAICLSSLSPPISDKSHISRIGVWFVCTEL